MPPHIEITFDMARIRRELESHGPAGGIYHSKESCWWSHYRSAAFQFGATMKCPLGTQIYFEKDWEGWLGAAEENPAYYGRHGILAFLSAHNSNVRDAIKGAPFAAKSWRPYNEALDVYLAEEARVR